MTRISPNLRTHSRSLTSSSESRRTSTETIFPTTLFTLPLELLTLLLTYLSTSDLIQFTNTCSQLHSLRNSTMALKISSYLRSRREDQENLLSSPSPDRLTLGPLTELNTSSQSDSPSPKFMFKTPVSVSTGSKRRSLTSDSSPSPLGLNTGPTTKTPLSSMEKKSKRRLRRLWDDSLIICVI